MNLKKYVNQVYELRLIQSSKALISFFTQLKNTLPADVSENFDKDKRLIEQLYEKLMINGCILTDEEIDELLSVYLIYSHSVNQMFQARANYSNIEKYFIYLMAISCIHKYYQVETKICEMLHIQKDAMIEDIMDACLMTRDLLLGLITYEQFNNGELPDQKDEEQKESLKDRFKNIKGEDIQSIEEDIEKFVTDCLEEVLYPVKHEYNRQILYIQKKNEILMSGYDNRLKDLLLSLKKNKSSDSE